jgi:hypothetical protein
MPGYSPSINPGSGLAGGTAPVVATSVIGATDNLLAPAWFLMLGAAALMRDRSRDPLR